MKNNDDALILVVDDDRFMRLYLRDLLSEAGFRVEVAADGLAAIEIYNTRQPELILMDLNMPGQDGIQTCREIRIRPKGTHSPVLMITSMDDEDSIQCAYEAGASDFIPKPIKDGILIQRIRYILRSTRNTKKLAKEKVRLDMIQRIARLSNWEWNPSTGEFRVSDETLNLLGRNDGKRISLFEDFLSIFSQDEGNRIESALKTAIARNTSCFLEFEIPGEYPTSSLFRLHGQMITETPEANGIMVGTIQDITELRLNEIRTQMLKRAIECLPIGISLVGRNGKTIYVNPAEAELHGYTAEELIGTEARQLAHHRFRKPFSPQQLDGFGTWTRESINMRKNGQEFPAQLTSVVVKDFSGEILGLVTTCEDITVKKNTENKIYNLAYFDVLTGLPNRSMFQDRLEHAIAHAQREKSKFCLLFLDLDNFKDVNDTYGHRLGDRLLHRVANRLSENLRESDTLARVGGDEFVLIVSSVYDQENASSAARRVMALFEMPFDIDGKMIYSSASVGIAMYPDDGLDNETLTKCADNAMYQAKKEGKSHFRFYSMEMHHKMMRRVAIENGLRFGLERKEFFLSYQPQWDLKTAGMTGVEVLIRWNSPEFGLMPPAEFISLTEDSGLIYELGEWILHTASFLTKKWILSEHKTFRIAINISAQQLKHPDFLAMIKRILTENCIDPAFIELEFTETVLMDDADKNIRILQSLKQMGIILSLDDFGTGYSSLNYLRNFPIDKIKIDRSFIKDINEKTDNVKIVKAIISLAQSLGLKVVAEGVENGDQLNILKKLGCHEVQGFYLAEPMSLEKITGMLGYRHTKIYS